MTAGMFLLGDDGRLTGLTERGYDSEDLLQTLLADYPDLLAGDQMAPDSPRRWLLVRREAGLPGEVGGADRWAIDHLFLDQDGVPTLVEVKRSTDTRIRREVVGQMLDYAANFVVYLPAGEIRNRFEATCGRVGIDPDEAIASTFDDATEPDAYWTRVARNIEAGRIRLVFVADAIPPELRRVVEFLNGQMSPTEVYAVEIKQYVAGPGAGSLKTLVPRLIGRTADAGRAKGERTGGGDSWTWDRFAAALDEIGGASLVARARLVYDWSAARGLRIWWGKGQIRGGFVVMYIEPSGKKHHLLELFSDGKLMVHFGYMARQGALADRDLRLEFHRRLTAVEGADLPGDDVIDRYPTIPLQALLTNEGVAGILDAFDWALENIRASGGTA